MRFTLLCASTALAAGLLLSACSSGGGSQSIPGGGSQAVAPMGHGVLHLVAMNRVESSGCPSSKYIECIDISKKTPGTATICISTSGNCSSGLQGDWTWKTVVTNLGGKSEKKHIKNAWSPNPGNPSTDTFTEKGKVKKSKGGSVKYVGNLTACPVTTSGSCLTGAIGLIPQ
ncbi:MAG: hypothetical protein WCB99_09890 [Candidatus Cybelea sp.]